MRLFDYQKIFLNSTDLLSFNKRYIDFGSHTFSHLHLSNLNLEEQRNEIKKMLLAIALFSFSLFFAGKDVFTERLNLANNDLHSIQENKFSSSTGYRYVWLLHGLESFQNNLLLSIICYFDST